uniref:Presequence protease, mitochondrial n=1 Tax=Sphaerodactylus townsendi TaxID=933632 RepID=A0ACB8FVW7_9SAUR
MTLAGGSGIEHFGMIYSAKLHPSETITVLLNSTDNERVFAQHLQNNILPDHTYGVVSGGHPLKIPDLSWEQLKQFHALHYHPSNARFFTYGNFPLEQHLKQIHEEALSKFQKIEPNTEVPPQQFWNKPREHHVTCGKDSFATDPKKQTMVSVSYLLSDITDNFETFTLHLLSSLLVGGPNSPFYKALIEAGLGTDFSPDVGPVRFVGLNKRLAPAELCSAFDWNRGLTGPTVTF